MNRQCVSGVTALRLGVAIALGPWCALAETETDPWTVLSRVNARLAEDLNEVRFVTAFLAMLCSDGTAKFVSAGHGPILVRQAAGKRVEEVVPSEPPLGIVDTWGACTTCSAELAPGATLVVVSDGILEARNSAGEQFGVERTIAAIDSAGRGSSTAIGNEIRHAVDGWMAGLPAADDQTLLIASLPRR